MLKATDVSFSYGDGRRTARRVIDRVSFDVERGTIVGLLGPNGSGKTTLVRILAGMLHPDSGRVVLDGASVIDMSRRDLARRVALVPQETHTPSSALGSVRTPIRVFSSFSTSAL